MPLSSPSCLFPPSYYRIPESEITLTFLTLSRHLLLSPPTFRVLVINSINTICRRNIAKLPFPESKGFSHRGIEVQIDRFETPRLPTFTWEDACDVMRGLLEYVSGERGAWKDQVYRIWMGKFLLGTGRISVRG